MLFWAMVFKTVPTFLLHKFVMIFQDGQTLYQLLISCLVFKLNVYFFLNLMFINWYFFPSGEDKEWHIQVPRITEGGNCSASIKSQFTSTDTDLIHLFLSLVKCPLYMTVQNSYCKTCCRKTVKLSFRYVCPMKIKT